MPVGRCRGCFQELLPKAARARDTVVAHVAASELTTPYLVQEKLNGMLVVWDGRELWSKTTAGACLPAPTWRERDVGSVRRRSSPDCCPPPSPSPCADGPGRPRTSPVGELYLGYGRQCFSMSQALATNALPTARTLGLGIREEARRNAWMHTRIVAFDAPGVGLAIPYGTRYAVLPRAGATGAPARVRVRWLGLGCNVIRRCGVPRRHSRSR